MEYIVSLPVFTTWPGISRPSCLFIVLLYSHLSPTHTLCKSFWHCADESNILILEFYCTWMGKINPIKFLVLPTASLIGRAWHKTTTHIEETPVPHCHSAECNYKSRLSGQPKDSVTSQSLTVSTFMYKSLCFPHFACLDLHAATEPKSDDLWLPSTESSPCSLGCSETGWDIV